MKEDSLILETNKCYRFILHVGRLALFKDDPEDVVKLYTGVIIGFIASREDIVFVLEIHIRKKDSFTVDAAYKVLVNDQVGWICPKLAKYESAQLVE